LHDDCPKFKAAAVSSAQVSLDDLRLKLAHEGGKPKMFKIVCTVLETFSHGSNELHDVSSGIRVFD